jgi:hypothetical protein
LILKEQISKLHEALCTANCTSLNAQERTRMSDVGNYNKITKDRKYNSNYSQKDAMFLVLFIFTDALCVSGGSSAHHQEHITLNTVLVLSTNIAASCYRGRDGWSSSLPW